MRFKGWERDPLFLSAIMVFKLNGYQFEIGRTGQIELSLSIYLEARDLQFPTNRILLGCSRSSYVVRICQRHSGT